jgi:hypothetical protein
MNNAYLPGRVAAGDFGSRCGMAKPDEYFARGFAKGSQSIPQNRPKRVQKRVYKIGRYP